MASNHFVRKLQKEAAAWAKTGLITPEQARAIVHSYDAQPRGPERAVRALVVLGCMFVGLALIVLIGENWEDIPRALRMGALVTLTAATQGYAVKLYFAGRRPAAEGVFVLGNLFYGGAIALIAQIYHLGEHMPDGIFLWALGSLPFGVLIGSAWVTLGAALLALLWIFLQATGGALFEWGFAVFLATQVYVLLRAASKTLFLVSLFGALLWLQFLAFGAHTEYWAHWKPAESSARALEQGAVLAFGASSLLAYAVGVWLRQQTHSHFRDYGALAVRTVTGFWLALLFVFNFPGPWRDFFRIFRDLQGEALLIAGVFLAPAFWFVRNSRQFPAILIAVLFSLWIVTVPTLMSQAHPLLAALFTGFFSVGLGIRFIVVGARRENSRLFHLGMLLIMTAALTRYLDLIGGYIGTAIVLALCGAMLIASARYWQQRRLAREGSET